MKKFNWFVLYVTLLVSHSFASTFIGNGGQVGDIELQVTLKSIYQTSETLLEEPQLCLCPENFKEHSMCEPLNNLNAQQINYCQNYIRIQNSKIISKLKDIQFEWIHDILQVDENSKNRAADAVTIRKENKIYLQQKRFLSLTPQERVFLIYHELNHTVLWENKPLDDNMVVGPYLGDYGGRNLINAASATFSIHGMNNNISENYASTLKRSQPTKRFWFSGMTSNVNLTSSRESSYKQKMDTGSHFGFRYQLLESPFGFSFKFQNNSAKKQILTSISAKENQKRTSLGVNYRYFPFNHLDITNGFSLSYLVFEFLYESLSGEYEVKDPQTGTQLTASNFAPNLVISYLVPLKYNFWINLGIQLDNQKLKYEAINLNYDKSEPTLFLGVTYGL